LKVNETPIGIVFLASLCPTLGALLNVWPFHIPALMVGLVYLYKINHLKLTQSYLVLYFAPALAILLIFQLLTERGFGILANGGYVLIFAIFFVSCFKTSGGVSLTIIIRGITYLYKFYMASLLLELFIVLIGFQSNLASLIRSTNAGGYKDYNGADVLQKLGFLDITGLNSILLGSQIAVMLSLFSVIWFIMLNKCMKKSKISQDSTLWINLSFFLFVMTLNLTGAILAALALITYVIGFNKKLSIFNLIIISIVLGGIAIFIDYIGLFNRIFRTDNLVINHMGPLDELEDSGVDMLVLATMSTRDYYFYVHALPIYNWLNEGIVDELFGVTRASILSQQVYRTGDFALAEILYTSGLVWLTVFIIFVLYSCVSALQSFRISSGIDRDHRIWAIFSAVNALISFLFLASLIHYPQATSNPGVIPLFSIHIALMIYAKLRCEFFSSSSHIKSRAFNLR
jgi:hypothetical protein